MSESTPPHSSPALRRGLLLLALLGLVQAAVQIGWSWRANPFARVPINDAEVYWQWAGRIARGELLGTEPFLSAPLYPYFVGLVRSLGGGLLALYVVQAALHVGAALLLSRAGARRFGARVGLAAGILLLLTGDASELVPRVLSGPVQLFVVALLLERWSAWQDRPKARGAAGLGLLFGAACLATPPLVVGFPILAFDLWRRTRGAAAPAAGVLTALLAIAPATLHNVLASGEWIAISAQAGVTFQHGNQPGSLGTYTASQGVSTSRVQQNRDALDEARESLGREVGWKEASRYYFGRGLASWRADPVWAVELAARKLVHFLFARQYGDIYMTGFEREAGLAPPRIVAPVQVAWIALPGLLAVGWWLARGGLRHLPEALLAGVSLLVVCTFWYSPRYRLAAVPVLALGAGWCLAAMAQRRGRAAIASAAAFGLALASGPLLEALDFERSESYRPTFDALLGGVLVQRGDFAAARAAYERAHAGGHPTAAVSLADLVRRSEGPEAALEELRRQAAERPQDPYTQRSLATALAESATANGDVRRFGQARAAFERSLALDRNDWQARLGLGHVLLGLDEPRAALEELERAADLAPERFEVHLGRALAHATLGEEEAELAALERALRCDPSQAGLRRQLAERRATRGEIAAGARLLRDGLERDAQDPSLRLALAWLLATTGDARLRDGARAVELARGANARDQREEVEKLDTLAAALAETGQLAAAIETAREALARLEAAGQGAWATELRARIATYERGEPWRQP